MPMNNNNTDNNIIIIIIIIIKSYMPVINFQCLNVKWNLSFFLREKRIFFYSVYLLSASILVLTFRGQKPKISLAELMKRKKHKNFLHKIRLRMRERFCQDITKHAHKIYKECFRVFKKNLEKSEKSDFDYSWRHPFMEDGDVKLDIKFHFNS